MPLKDAQITLLTQLVLNALKEAKAESEKVRQYLPDFFERLREDLVNEMRGERELKAGNQDHSLHQVSDEVGSPTWKY